MALQLHGGTLCIDIGGTGIKGLVVDPLGQPLNERVRLETPRPATAVAVLATIRRLILEQPAFERVSVGFPGVVVGGVAHTAPNLDGDWDGFPIAAEVAGLTQAPTRAANDADIAGFGVIEGRGLEMLVTLGTGMGSALYVDGKLVPNLELGHHPLRKGRTYEQFVCNAELERIGKKMWSKRVKKAIRQIEPIWNYRLLYLGGGNARKIRGALPENVKVVGNIAGLLGGIRLWET